VKLDPRKAMMDMLAKRVVEEVDNVPPDTVVPPVLQKEAAPSSSSPPNPRKAMMEMLAKRGQKDGNSTSTCVDAPPLRSSLDPRKPILGNDGHVKEQESSSITDNPVILLKNCMKYGKYFKMLKVGLPQPAVAHKMVSEGAVGSLEAGLEILCLGPEV
jgi:hypothetical protein